MTCGARLGRRTARLCALAACAGALFLVYLHLSRTSWVNSDGASNALQARDMLRGNVLLSGWTLTDVTFYTVELPLYALVEAVHGLDADTVHIAAAATYTLVLLAACALAADRARGRARAARVGVTLFLLAAPPPGIATGVLLLSPDHFGTSLPLLLLVWLADRPDPGRLVPAGVCLGLAWTLVADTTALYLGVLPMAAVYGWRALRRRSPLGADAKLCYAAVLAYPLARAAESAIRSAGGYTAYRPSTAMAPSGLWPAHAAKAAQSFLLLYGIDTASPPSAVTLGVWVLRAAGVGCVGWALWRLARRVPGAGPADAVLALALLVNLAAFTVSTMAGTGVLAREVSDTLPLGAALAGRLVGPRLAAARLAPLLPLALAGALALLVSGLRQPQTPPAGDRIAQWLAGHGYGYGLAGYWDASVLTVETGERVGVRPIDLGGAAPAPPAWDSSTAWYDPAVHDARFVIVDPYDARGISAADARRAYGPPAAAYQVANRIVYVYARDLLDRPATG